MPWQVATGHSDPGARPMDVLTHSHLTASVAKGSSSWLVPTLRDVLENTPSGLPCLYPWSTQQESSNIFQKGADLMAKMGCGHTSQPGLSLTPCQSLPLALGLGQERRSGKARRARWRNIWKLAERFSFLPNSL